MAKSGETDPRWIVEQREDWANVNNWHWDERDMSSWASEKLRKLLIGSKYEKDIIWSITDVEITGIATINIRKGKIKKLHDLEIDIDFKCDNEGTEVKGKIYIPEFSYDTGAEKVKYFVSFDEKDGKTQELVEKIKTGCPNHFKPLFEKFIKEFFSFGDSIRLPQKQDVSQPGEKFSMPDTQKCNTDKCDSTQSLELEYEFNCPPNFLYDLFTNPEKIQMYTQSKTTFKGLINTEYSMLNGVISGKILELNKDNKIVMSWRFNNWQKDYYSKVTLVFKPLNGGSKLSLTHKDIPTSDFERVSQGWPQYFIQPMQNLFAIGSTDISAALF